MLIVTGIAKIGSEDVEHIKVAAAKMAKASRAETGCRAYAFYQDIEDPCCFRIYEEWESRDALAAHFKTTHMAAFNAVLKDLDIKSLDISQFMRGKGVTVG